MAFNHFEDFRIEVEKDIYIYGVKGGEGRPILLLHGYPENHCMWDDVANRLVEKGFCVVATDLRGYGDSSKPVGSADHSNYSKKVMAADQVKVMNALGFEKFDLVGHDRGARVAHRLVLDYPQNVRSCMLMDIVPTYYMYKNTDLRFATGYYHWFFLIQSGNMPEHLIGADPEYFLRGSMTGFREGVISPAKEENLQEYVRTFSAPGGVHATCEDYRAGATIDMKDDEADLDKKISVPLKVIWGSKGLVGNIYDVLKIWEERAVSVEGKGLPCGHFIPEQLPNETTEEIVSWLAKN